MASDTVRTCLRGTERNQDSSAWRRRGDSGRWNAELHAMLEKAKCGTRHGPGSPAVVHGVQWWRGLDFKAMGDWAGAAG